MDWAQKRKIFYAVMFVLVIVLVASYPFYTATHKDPTCFDQKQNGGETGVDCGGPCARMCTSEMKPLNTIWAKAFSLRGGKYDIGAYVENSNFNAGIKNLRYILTVKDAQGKVLAEKGNAVEIPPATSVLLFEGGVAMSGTPATVEVIFNQEDLTRWIKAQPAPLLVATKNQSLRNADTAPRFDATLVNKDLVNDVTNLALGAVIYDAGRHPLAVSHTFVDRIPKGSEQNIFFTWPDRIGSMVTASVCTPSETMFIVDRSGSMDNGQDPPEPITTVKKSLTAYLDGVGERNKAGLVSFATTVSKPIDQELSSDRTRVTNAIAGMHVFAGGSQETDIGEAIERAQDEFASVRHTPETKKIMIILTDGVANMPLDPLGTKNTEYAESYAARAASFAGRSGVELYAIGLGPLVNEAFLRDKIATDSGHYFSAPTGVYLPNIYKKIAEIVCGAGTTASPAQEDFITEVVMTPRAVFSQ